MVDYSKFKSAVRSIALEVCKQLGAKEVPTRPWNRIIREGEGRTSFPTEHRPDFSGLTMEIYSMVEHSTHVEDIVKVSEEYQTLKSRFIVAPVV